MQNKINLFNCAFIASNSDVPVPVSSKPVRCFLHMMNQEFQKKQDINSTGTPRFKVMETPQVDAVPARVSKILRLSQPRLRNMGK
jgi:hypothetical protein